MNTRRITTLITLAVAVLATSGAPASAATGTGLEFAADSPVTSFRATSQGRRFGSSFTDNMTWSAPGDFISIKRSPEFSGREIVVERSTVDQYGMGNRRGLTSGQNTRNPFPAQPDGYRELINIPFLGVDTMLARHRAGTALLQEVTVNGRALLRGTAALSANECAGLAKGTLTIDLDPATLLPVSLTEVHGTRTTDRYTVSYNSIGTQFDRSVFALLPPRRRGAISTSSQGFRRASAASVDARVPWQLMLPTSVPVGFGLTMLGYAPRSGRVGPEASIDPVRHYTAAVYTRGVEQLELTARRSTTIAAREWRTSDPFAGECADVELGSIAIGSITGRYGIGPTLTPHIFWEQSGALYTLAGPYPPSELARIAASMAPAA